MGGVCLGSYRFSSLPNCLTCLSAPLFSPWVGFGGSAIAALFIYFFRAEVHRGPRGAGPGPQASTNLGRRTTCTSHFFLFSAASARAARVLSTQLPSPSTYLQTPPFHPASLPQLVRPSASPHFRPPARPPACPCIVSWVCVPLSLCPGVCKWIHPGRE